MYLPVRFLIGSLERRICFKHIHSQSKTNSSQLQYRQRKLMGIGGGISRISMSSNIPSPSDVSRFVVLECTISCLYPITIDDNIFTNRS